MSRILREETLEKFIQEYKLDCNSIIVKVDKEKHKAYYIVDGELIVESTYDEILKWI